MTYLQQFEKILTKAKFKLKALNFIERLVNTCAAAGTGREYGSKRPRMGIISDLLVHV